MADAVKRHYRSQARAEAAAATRAAIRTGATELFCETGYAATTMKAVAARAGVGERTLYDAFPNKSALFEHVVGVAITGDEGTLPVAERPEFRAALDGADSAAAVAHFARYSAEILERAAPLITVAIESAGADPALRRFSDQGATATRLNASRFVSSLAEHGLVDGEVDDMAMAAYALLIPLVHQHLRRDVGWSADHYRRWLEESLARILIR